MSALLSLSAFLLPLLHNLIFFLIHLLRLCLFATILQHIRQHTVILLIELRITGHIAADVLLADLEAFHHFPVQDLISQKGHLRKIFLPQLLDLLFLGLGQVSYRLLQKIQFCGAVSKQISHTVFHRLPAVQRNGDIFALCHPVYLFYV